jgi:hypothetical protein
MNNDVSLPGTSRMDGGIVDRRRTRGCARGAGRLGEFEAGAAAGPRVLEACREDGGGCMIGTTNDE